MDYLSNEYLYNTFLYILFIFSENCVRYSFIHVPHDLNRRSKYSQTGDICLIESLNIAGNGGLFLLLLYLKFVFYREGTRMHTKKRKSLGHETHYAYHKTHSLYLQTDCCKLLLVMWFAIILQFYVQNNLSIKEQTPNILCW